MSEFMIRFFFCNILISMIIGLFLLAKHLLKKKLTSRMQYNLWFLLLGLLAVPFLPNQIKIRFPHIFTWFRGLKHTSPSPVGAVMKEAAAQSQSPTASWMNDFGISISQKTPSFIGSILYILWLIGIFMMLMLVTASIRRFRSMKRSALPLQNAAVQTLYHDCLRTMHIKKPIPVYSTAFLRSPVITGLFQPRIYLPIHLISDYSSKDIRYILMHELVHYQYKDAIANYFMNIIGVLYWFHPLVWYSLKEMKNDREVACDTSVLKLLDEDAYADYGNTLISFAQKVSLTPFPFSSEACGSMKQMQKRIKNIADYHPASFRKNLYSTIAYLVLALFLLGAAPLLSIQAADQDHYYFHEADRKLTYLDLSDVFAAYDGSFVLYDAKEDSWQIYNQDSAATRIAPASTFKIYSALFGLEAGSITPERSCISWNGQDYSYDSWNADQTLASAMQNSVTWYFQTLDQQTGWSLIQQYIQKIGYGNRRMEGDLSSYWMDSTLKISPIEQVELLTKLYNNELGFSEANLRTVKDAILLSSTDNGALSGKTGTIAINGENRCGWFIGYIEKNDRTYFFATSIQCEKLACGPSAAELTFSILSDLKLWDAVQEKGVKEKVDFWAHFTKGS